MANSEENTLHRSSAVASTAKHRWQLLARAIKKNRHGRSSTSLAKDPVSVRRFQSFGILQQIKCNCLHVADDGNTVNHLNRPDFDMWFNFCIPHFPNFSVSIKLLDDASNLSDLIGFNNTGNICIWPSEEVMTYYCLKHSNFFLGKNLCELGGGMTCLAGLGVATTCAADKVLLTDGNAQCVVNLLALIEQNKPSVKCSVLTAELIRWDKQDTFVDHSNQFDIILCADCLFFDEYREDLLHTLTQLLKSDGIVWIFAPSRGETLNLFTATAAKNFHVAIKHDYDPLVSKLHNEALNCNSSYKPDLHYPQFIVMQKK